MHGTASSASRDQQTPLLSAITYIPSSKCRRHVTVQQWSMPKPDIGRKSQFLPQIGGPHPCGNIAITFGTENENGMATDSEKKLWRYVYSFWQNTRTWHTDRRTPRDGIGRAYAQHRAAKTTALGEAMPSNCVVGRMRLYVRTRSQKHRNNVFIYFSSYVIHCRFYVRLMSHMAVKLQ